MENHKHGFFIRVICIFFSYLILIPVSLAADSLDLYVSPTGSDGAQGTQDAPFKTILKASQVAQPGTVVHVASGIYEGSFMTKASGTSADRIIYRSDTVGGAKIVPKHDSNTKVGWDNRGAYVTIDGFEVDGSQDPVSGKKWTVGLNVAAAGDIVTNCYVHHIYNTGIGNAGGGAGILLDSYHGFHDMHAWNNIVHDIGPSGKFGSHYHGVYQTATGTIKYNITYGNSGAGIHLWHDARDIEITNNLTFGNSIGIILGGGDYINDRGLCNDIHVSNNIAFDNSKTGIAEAGECGKRNTFTNNMSFQNGRDWGLKFSKHTEDDNLQEEMGIFPVE